MFRSSSARSAGVTLGPGGQRPVSRMRAIRSCAAISAERGVRLGIVDLAIVGADGLDDRPRGEFAARIVAAQRANVGDLVDELGDEPTQRDLARDLARVVARDRAGVVLLVGPTLVRTTSAIEVDVRRLVDERRRPSRASPGDAPR